MKTAIPILGFCAWSGTGKTTLLRQLIPRLNRRGLRVSAIKHAHHHFDLDQPGKDSFELRKAGAAQTVVCTRTRMAMITEFDAAHEEPPLEAIVAQLDPARADLVLVEGYKDIRFAKIELHREALEKPYLFEQDDSVVALACDHPPPPNLPIPALDLNDIDDIARFICEDFFPRR